MQLMDNMASFLRAFAEKNNLSLAKLQEIIDISRNAMYAYSRGEGNPMISTVEYIAERLEVNPIAILSGVYEPGGKDVYVLLLNTVEGVSELTPEDRQKFIRLFALEMVKLWDEE